LLIQALGHSLSYVLVLRLTIVFVIGLLDDLFTRFDAIAAASGLEKIKTIGDDDMALAGAPLPRADHANAALRTAQQWLEATDRWRADHAVELQLRSGWPADPRLGGVIGQHRILFDLWGDTVNTAQRMEATGLPGRIQVSSTTRERCQINSPWYRAPWT
jgi:adenylate cyclase